ncbi:uncharacterized protein [Dermacentor andersoni]|uniref:uncharacterized protein n=1 Tax=Dermacentor andersoni TaxID=34620 RepID=UPI003B3A93EB
MPLRAIVSEKEAWQGLVSKYLKKHLSQIDVEDPFRVSNSKDVIEFLGEQDGASQANFAFSVDIEELFYSIPQTELLDAVKERIENWGAVEFQNSSGVSVNDFVALVECYLSSTYICFNDKLFVQKDGICIGSCIAPILSEIFLSQFDKRVAARIKQEKRVVKCFRYVDDFIVFVNVENESDKPQVVKSVLEIFGDCSGKLRFTHEVPMNGCLQFLELCLHFGTGHICWSYQPRTKKEILAYNSAHSKLVKRGIAKNCLRGALEKSCHHKIEVSLQKQVLRLQNAGFPKEIVTAVAECLLKEIRAGGRPGVAGEKSCKKLKCTAIPYVHQLSHRLRKVGEKCGVDVMFTAPEKLVRMCKAVNEKKKPVCAIKHACMFVPCIVGVVYRIPLSCGRCYVGQTGRCLNERLREHRTLVDSLAGGGHLAMHCKRCGCVPAFDTCVFLRHITLTGKPKVSPLRRHARDAAQQKSSRTTATSQRLVTRECGRDAQPP